MLLVLKRIRNSIVLLQEVRDRIKESFVGINPANLRLEVYQEPKAVIIDTSRGRIVADLPIKEARELFNELTREGIEP